MNLEELQSYEEWYFSWWLDDLKKHGVINNYLYESNKFVLSENKKYPILRQLKTKTRTDYLTLLQEHIYTPDFLVEWNDEYQNIYFRIINDDMCSIKAPFFAIKGKKNNKSYTFFEVKPHFDQNNMTRLFRISQKWLYDKYGLYVELVIIPDLFMKTFTPERYLYTDKSRQLRKIDFNIKTIEKYLNNEKF